MLHAVKWFIDKIVTKAIKDVENYKTPITSNPIKRGLELEITNLVSQLTGEVISKGEPIEMVYAKIIRALQQVQK